MIAIELKDVERTFGKVVAVNKLNLEIPRGSLFGLIGPNGAGKTTTLRMLAGLLRPTSGEILLNGKPIEPGNEQYKRKIGYMPDFFGVYEDLLVWEYLDFFGRCYELPAEHRVQVVDELLELVDLQGKRDVQVQTLSRGMRQRLCLAHALVHDPEILLLDEPASGLDPRARVEMRELLRELGAMGKTIILSSHILAELAELCDSIGIIEKGELVVSGTLASIQQKAQSEHWLRIGIISDKAHAEKVLKELPSVTAFRSPLAGSSNGEYEVEVSGDENTVANLLEALVLQKIKVVSFHQLSNDLEDIFMHLTRGEVA